MAAGMLHKYGPRQPFGVPYADSFSTLPCANHSVNNYIVIVTTLHIALK
jgi:hypothetical protein